jgi:hypothetical protein
MDEFKGDGYLVFFGVLEIYAREFSTKDDWVLCEKLSFFRHKLHISCSRFKKILSKIDKWDVSFSGDSVSIYIPKFKELMDESTLKKLREHEKSFRNSSGIVPKSDTTDKEADKDKDKDKDKRGENRKRFIPPSFGDIKEYCRERNNGVNPQVWIDFYTANGWMIGKNKMKDWKASVRTWEQRNQTPAYKDPYANSKGGDSWK